MSDHLIITKICKLFGLLLVLAVLVTGEAIAGECAGSSGSDSDSLTIGNGDGALAVYLGWNPNQTPFGYVAHASLGERYAYVQLDKPEYLGSDPCITGNIGGRTPIHDISAQRTIFYQATRHSDSGMEESCHIDFNIPWTASGFRSSIAFQAQVIVAGVVISISEYTWQSGNRPGTFVIPAGVMQSTAQPLISGTAFIDPPVGGVSIFLLGSAGWNAERIQFDRIDECGTIALVPAPATSGIEVKQPGTQGPVIPESSIAIQEGDVSESGTITGTVISSVHVAPVDQGRVSIYGASGDLIDSRDLQIGPYLFINLEPGTYYARTESTGFFDELSDDILCLFGNCTVTDGNPILVTSGSVSFADFELEGPGGQIFFDDFEASGGE